MEENMDRRQRKTREAIFSAFVALLSQKDFGQITVGEIIDCADVGRATFYAHFETKDFLLKELCDELFCHVFDALGTDRTEHKHIFDCNPPASPFLHLFQHLQKNDNNLLKLLSGQNRELFLPYFKSDLRQLIENQSHLFEKKKHEKVPESFWVDHIASTFVETLKWWTDHGLKESPETITEYFYLVL